VTETHGPTLQIRRLGGRYAAVTRATDGVQAVIFPFESGPVPLRFPVTVHLPDPVHPVKIDARPPA